MFPTLTKFIKQIVEAVLFYGNNVLIAWFYSLSKLD